MGQKVINVINAVIKLEYRDGKLASVESNVQKPRAHVLNLCWRVQFSWYAALRDLLSNVRGQRDAGGHGTGDVTETTAAARGRADAAGIPSQNVLKKT